MTRFAGSVALVTGAARPRSIGRATALRLAADGAAVACLDIARSYDDAPMHGVASSDDLDGLVAEIEAAGGRALAVRADVSDADAVEAAVAAATEALGTIDLVANVAGGSGPGFGLGPLVALPDSEFRRVFEVNVTGTWLVSKACASRMLAAGTPGRICNVSSQAGKKAFPMIGAYSAAKAAVISITQAMVGGQDGFDAFLEREIPLRRLQSPEEIAAAICWLLSDDARGVTGEAMNVSAGQTMV